MVGELGAERLDFGVQGQLTLAQRRHAPTQFRQRQQVLLIGGEKPLHALLYSRQIPVERFLATLRRMCLARHFKPPIQLGLDERRILQQAQDFGPYDAFQQVQPDRALITAGLAVVAIRT